MQQEMLNRQQTDCGRLLDVCTGSGCIAITLAHVLEWKEVWASDISADALSVAGRNNEALDGGVQFVQSDLLENIAKEPKWDVIVSNPPYIESAVIKTLAREVREHEPRLALDGAQDGLCCYRRLVSDAREYLKKEGLLFLEIGANQGQAVRQLCYENGYQDVRIVADLAGLDRVVWARFCG
jgi:release factor glutamine methyltransferase